MRRALAAVVAVLAAPAAARAGGLYAGDPGAQAQQRGGAFVAKADDPTALAANPAGLAATGRGALSLGANVLDFRLSFDRDGVYQEWSAGPPAEPGFAGQEMPAVSHEGPAQPVPLLAVAVRVTPRLVLAAGLHAPQGYPNRTLPESVTLAGGVSAPAPQRYDTVSQESLVVMGSLGGALEVRDDLELGVRLSYGYGALHAKSHVWGGVNHAEDPGFDAVFDADVKDRFVPSYGVGVKWRPTRELEVGVAYSSELRLELVGSSTAALGGKLGFGGLQARIVPIEDARARCAPGGTPDALATCITLVIPRFAQAGARWRWLDAAGQERGDVEVDVRWEDWSAASDARIVVDGENDLTTQDLLPSLLRHGFEDVWSVRVGGALRLPAGAVVIEPRAGVWYDTAAAPDSWQRLDFDGSSRLGLAGGVAVAGQGGAWRVELGGAVMLSPDRVAAGADPFGPSLPPGEPAAGERTQPDPILPNESEDRQYRHPINGGRFESGYRVISAAVTVAW